MSNIIASIADESEDANLWLEQTYDPKALAWAAERTAKARAALGGLPIYPQLRSEIADAVKRSAPTPFFFFLGDKLIRVRMDADHPQGVLELAERDAQGHPNVWRPVLDIDALNAAEGQTYDLHQHFQRLHKVVLPPRYERLLFPLPPGGGDEIEWREFDLVKGAFVEGGFRTPASYSEAVWLNEDRLLIAHTLDGAPLSGNGRAPAQAYIWDRGTPIEDARPVLRLAPSDGLMYIDAVGSGVARRAVVTRVHDYSTFSFAIVDQDGGVSEVALPRKLKSWPFKAATERHFLVQLAEDADVAGTPRKAESLIAYNVHPDTPDAERASFVHRFDNDEFANEKTGFAGTRTGFYIIAEQRTRHRLLSARLDQGSWRIEEALAAPQGTVLTFSDWSAGGNEAGEEVWIQQTGYLTPPRVDLLAPGKPPITIHSDTPLIDPDAFKVEIRTATSRDGMKIDYYLLKPRKITHPGASPTLMTGYGGYGVSLKPGYFDRQVGGHSLKLWLDRGGALAMPLIRGGGERGEIWHSSVVRENRQKSYDDFIAAAEDLIASGFTRPEHFGIFGMSHGGLLTGVVGVQRPDLFGAVVCDAAGLDVVRTAPRMPNEYGDRQDPVMLKAMLAYSPYQNFRAGRTYPPFLITISTTDDRVNPGTSRMFVARGEEIGTKVWLIEEPEGGHGVSDCLTHPELMSMRMAFLIDALM